MLVGRQMMAMVAAYAKIPDSNISAPQYFILQTLVYEEQLTCSHFAHALDVTLSAVTNLSNKLVRKGYIERIPSATDRRQVYLRITEKGREVERRLLARYQQLTKGLWEDLAEQEIELLVEVYSKMIEHLQRRMKSKPETQISEEVDSNGKSGP